MVEIPGIAPTPLVAPTSADRDEPRRPALSPSRAADFKQCPLLYRFRAIDRLPEVPTPAQLRGTLVHAVLERLLALPAAERVPAAARALVAPAWQQLCADAAGRFATPSGTAPGGTAPGGTAPPGGDRSGDTADLPWHLDATAWPAGVDGLLDAYFALEDPRLVEPEACEQRVEVELESGLLLRGFVDRVDRIGDDYRVVDYKTGAAPGPTTEARALFPMKFYALVLLLLRGRAPRELRLMYLTGAVALHYVPDEEQLRRFGRTLDAMWSAIRAADAAGEFRPDPGPACGWCSHRALCPAWGGTPPPYPGRHAPEGPTPQRSEAEIPRWDDEPVGA